MRDRIRALRKSAGLRHGLTMGVAMVLAGGLDYGVNVLAGRWLVPIEYGVFVAVAAILQVLVNVTNAIRNVVAFYTSELSARAETKKLGAFIHQAWGWSWRWGLLGTAAMAVVSPLIARALRLPGPWPLWAACPSVLLLFVRPITDGALQGIQAFGRFGMVQVLQSLLRLLFAALLIWLGFQSAGAIFALPLACAVALLLALWFLRPLFRERAPTSGHAVSWHYSAYTLLGLGAFAVVTNLDAVFVKRFFSPEVAGNYGPVVTLAKVSLFLPMAIGIVLFPKVTQRQVAGKDPRPILLTALAATLLPGLVLTSIYFMFHGVLVKLIFTRAYTDPGVVLVLATLASTLFAGLNIWLNYALSLERPGFVYALVGVFAWQATAMLLFGRSNLVRMTWAMVSAGVVGNVAGYMTTRFRVVNSTRAGAEVAGV